MTDCFGLAESIAAAGENVEIWRRGAQTSGAGGHPVDAPTLLTTRRIAIRQLSAGEAERAFGLQTDARWIASLPATQDVKANDFLKILTGHDVNVILEVRADPRHEGGSQILELADTTETLT